MWHIGFALAVSFAAAILGLAGLTWLAWILLNHPRVPHPGVLSLHDTVGVMQLVFASVAGAGVLVALIVAYRRQKIAEAVVAELVRAADSNGDSNSASQTLPRTHDNIQPRLDLISRTGRPLRPKSGRSSVRARPVDLRSVVHVEYTPAADLETWQATSLRSYSSLSP